MKVGLQRAYDQVAARWPNLDLIEFVRHRPQQGIVAGLLVIAVLLGAVDLAMKSSSASGSKTQLTKSVAPKFQDRPPSEFAASAPLSTNPLEPNPPPDLTAAEVFNVSNGHPRGGLVRVPKKAWSPRPNPQRKCAAQLQYFNRRPLRELDQSPFLRRSLSGRSLKRRNRRQRHQGEWCKGHKNPSQRNLESSATTTIPNDSYSFLNMRSSIFARRLKLAR